MPLTSPDQIDYPGLTSPGGFRALMATMATSIQAALKTRATTGTYRYANAAARELVFPSTGATPVGTRTRLDTDLFDREWTGSKWVPSGAGLLPIKPTSVSGGSFLVGGQVVYSGTTAAIGVGGCFSEDFDAYKIVIQEVSTGGVSGFIFASGGVTLGTHQSQLAIRSGSSQTTSSTTSAGGVELGGAASGSRTIQVEAFLRQGPYSHLMGKATDLSNGFTAYEVAGRATGVPNGFILTNSGGGSRTGRLRIFGYRNNDV